MLAAELATAAELPGRADRRPGSRFAVGLSGVCSLLISASWFFFIHWLAAERRGSAGRWRFRFCFATGSTAALAELGVGFATAGRPAQGGALAEPLEAGRLCRRRSSPPRYHDESDRCPRPQFAAGAAPLFALNNRGALSTFYNHSARTRARVDRYSCLISAALADRHFIFVLSAALAEPLGAGN